MSAIALDPLIAEAKRRARRRHLLAAASLVAAVAVAATLATRSSDRPHLVVAPPACRAGQLHVALIHSGAAAGTGGEEFAFANASRGACVLSGWPSFRLVMPHGRTVTPRPHELIALGYSIAHPPALPRVSLAPGSTTGWFLQQADTTPHGGLCPRSTSMLVTPPGASRAISVAAHLPFCGPRHFWALPVGRAS